MSGKRVGPREMVSIRFSFPGVEHAACADRLDVDFFPEDGTGLAAPVAVCNSCPVKEACLDAALDLPVDKDHGVLGGMSMRQRNKLRKARR